MGRQLEEEKKFINIKNAEKEHKLNEEINDEIKLCR